MGKYRASSSQKQFVHRLIRPDLFVSNDSKELTKLYMRQSTTAQQMHVYDNVCKYLSTQDNICKQELLQVAVSNSTGTHQGY